MLAHKPLGKLETPTKIPTGVATVGMKGVGVFETVEGVFEGLMVQINFKASGRLGETRRPSGHKYNDCRPQVRFSDRTHPVPTASSSRQDIPRAPTGSKTLHTKLSREGHYQGNPNSSTPIFFKCISCAQEKQHLQASNQPIPLKYPTKCSEIQDGVCRQNCTVLDGTPLGHHCGLGRRFLSCPHCLGIPQVLCL